MLKVKMEQDIPVLDESYEETMAENELPGFLSESRLPPLPDASIMTMSPSMSPTMPNMSPTLSPFLIDTNTTNSPTLLNSNSSSSIEYDKPDEAEEVDPEEQKNFLIVGGGVVSFPEYLEHYQPVCSILRTLNIHGKDYIVHACGCTMIAPDMALTAAHCKEYADYVKVGKLFRKTETNENYGLDVETFRVEKVKVHDNFNPFTFSHDVAILKLSGETSKPLVTLQFSKIARSTTEDSTVVGWGFTSYDSQIPPDALRDVNVRFIPKLSCENFYGDVMRDTSMFCAHAPGKDACQGDSGGPIFRTNIHGKRIQIGIISWGYKCALYPGVYTDISDESISAFIRKAICDKRPSKRKVNCDGNELINSV